MKETIFPRAGRCQCDEGVGIWPILIAAGKVIAGAAGKAAAGAAASGLIARAMQSKKMPKEIKRLFGGKDRDKQTWNWYRSVAGQNPGRDYSEETFEVAWQGFNELNWDKWWRDVHHKITQSSPWGVNNIPHWIANAVVDAICTGKVAPDATTGAIFDTVIWPVFAPFWPDWSAQYPANKQILVDWVDRVAADLPIGETRNSRRHEHILPADLIARLCPQLKPLGAPSSVAPPAAPAPVVEDRKQTIPTQIPGPAPLPAGATDADLREAVAQIGAQLRAQSSGVPAEEVARIAERTALQWLATQGVRSTPEIKETVVKASAAPQGMPGWAMGLMVVAGLFALARPVPMARTARRK